MTSSTARDPAELVDAGSWEHYEDPLLYDYEYRRRRQDARFYRDLATSRVSDGSVLELACGTGRVTSAIARGGVPVVGTDLSAPMLQRARARVFRLGRAVRGRTGFVRADMRRFAFNRRFPLIVMAFNSFEHLYTRVDVAACLECVRAHLEPGGEFAFDVQNPDMRWLLRDPDRHWARTVFRHPVTGRRTEYTTNHVYDSISQIAVIRLYYKPLEGSRRRTDVVTLSQRKFFPAELEALLHTNGFSAVHRYGDFDGEPLTDDAESQLLVCRAR